MRNLRSISFALGMLALLPLPSFAAAAPAPALGLHLAPCMQGRAHLPASCGTFGVYENRAARSGRIIALRVLVVKAKHPSHRAIAWITGGPGQSAVDDAQAIVGGQFARGVLALRDTYDLVFVDNRGMGDSNPSRCDIAPRSRPAAYFGELWPHAILAACRNAYGALADPNFYHTDAAVDDVDDVRAALGYRKVVLVGGSYGTFFSLVFMRRHPEHVESAVLDGVLPPHFQPLPGAPDGAQTALDDLIAKCARDARCHAHFPRFGEHVAMLVRRFDHGPLAVRVKNAQTKRVETVLLAKEVFVDRLRQVLYDPGAAAYVPYVVERAYDGDMLPLGAMIDVTTRGLAQDLDEGAYLSYSCADFMPFISPTQLATAAARSFAADLRIRAQRRACAIWNVRPMPPSFNAIVRSDVPTLVLSGGDDPATPPQYVARQMPYLPNAKQVLVRGAGHATETACTDRLITAFVRAGSAQALDVSRCTAAFDPPRFATSMAGWPEL